MFYRLIFSILSLTCLNFLQAEDTIETAVSSSVEDLAFTEATEDTETIIDEFTETPLDKFTNQGFLLWDYLSDVAKGDLPTHFDELTELCVRRKIRKVIVFIKNPQYFSFFSTSKTSKNSFIAKANKLYDTMVNPSEPVVKDFEIAVFFETGDFVSTAAAGIAPTVNPLPDTALANYFSDLKEMLDWSKSMKAQVPGITEIAFDPEASGANASIQQLVYNYCDEYKWLNNLGEIKIGTTLGIDESKETYANLSTFPVNPIFSGHISNFPTDPSWDRGNDPKAPLLQSIYIQVYQTSIPAMFAAGYNKALGTHSGSLAASYFNKMLKDLPYINGEGTISFTKGEYPVTGQDTVFKEFSDPFLFADDNSLNPPIKNRKIAIVGSVTDNTHLDFETKAVFTKADTAFKRTETVTAWNTQQGITQDVVNNIYWMMSLNYDTSLKAPLTFFGNWQLGDFMDFVSNSVTINNVEATKPFINLTFPANNFVIYDYNFATSIVNIVPQSEGKTDPWDL